jgi:hypothetical protein
MKSNLFLQNPYIRNSIQLVSIKMKATVAKGFSHLKKLTENKFGDLNLSPLSLHPKFFFKLLLLIQKGGGTWPDDTLATYTRYKVLIPTQEIEIDKSGHSF